MHGMRIRTIAWAGAWILGCGSPVLRDAGVRPVEEGAKPPPGYRAPVAMADLDAVVARGELLVRLDRAVEIGLSMVHTSRAASEGAILLPVATMDDPMRVAEVRFVRFPSPPKGPEDLEAAEIHANVGVVFPEERVLQVELVGKPVDPSTVVGMQVHAVLAATAALARRDAGRFRLHAVPERVPTDTNRFGYVDQVRVHALADGNAGTDYDLVVRPPERGTAAEVATIAEADRFDLELRQVDVPAPTPTPSAVARAGTLLARGAGEVTITCAEGAVYRAVLGRAGVEVRRVAAKADEGAVR
ncbi:MAG: hypothetical protein D6705_06920 [Deltaproteobacteria bacterium]|nr:MAG: hypothetical protein D6705_06920 [Deltaproteobacteria bacterium]